MRLLPPSRTWLYAGQRMPEGSKRRSSSTILSASAVVMLADSVRRYYQLEMPSIVFLIPPLPSRPFPAFSSLASEVKEY
jgi:hypothetical protein